MKTILYSILAILFISTLYSQQINFISVEENDPRNCAPYCDYLHQRVKYDPSGKIRIITYDGLRFYEAVYNNNYFTSLKPIAKGLINIPELTNASAYYYDFDIDTDSVVHIAFTVFRFGSVFYDSAKVYMFYTNSQMDSVIYLGKTTFPQPNDYRDYYHTVNVLRTTDNKIVVNYLHYSHPGDAWDQSISIKWTQLVNPSANNLQLKYRQINLPGVYPSKYFSVYANKNLYANLYQYDQGSAYPYDTLYISYNLLKYDINNLSNDATLRTIDTLILKGSNVSVELPIYSADYNDGNVLISSILVSYPPHYISISNPLAKSIFTLDRQNNLHVIKYSNNQITYKRYDNSGNLNLSHTINKSYFFPVNIGINDDYILNNGSIAALNPNNAVILFNYTSGGGAYIIHQLQGNLNYKMLFPSRPLYPYPYRELNFVRKENKIYLFNPTRVYGNLSDSVLIIPLYEVREQNNEFLTDLDDLSIVNIQIQNVPNFKYPFAKVDKNNQIHLLLFKFLKFGPAASELGQFYYFEVTNDWQVQGGERVVAENDTLYILSDIDFDIDGNGVVHVVYFRWLFGSRKVMVYTNNSSGTFATPIQISDTLTSYTGDWFRAKATRDGKVYIVYYDNTNSSVKVIYGDLNGFSTPKRLFVHSSIDRGGGRNKISFEVDFQGNLHCFDMSDFPTYLRYPYKVIHDSVIFINRSYSTYTGPNGPQFVTTTQDENWNIHVIGITNNEKIYYLNSFDNFQSFRTYELANYDIFKHLNTADLFWDYFKPFADSDRQRVYFLLGRALAYSLLGWVPYLPTGVEKTENIIPETFTLYQNYPNPFNPSTYISFDLPRSAKVKISVYDVIGRLVKVLVDEQMPAGIHKVEFRGDGLSSGAYFYRLEAGCFTSVKKMLLVK